VNTYASMTLLIFFAFVVIEAFIRWRERREDRR
jgi:hypothetical protein